MSAYDFSFNAIDGTALPLEDFRGKAVLVVNTASQCGLTPQYGALESLYQQYRDRGLVVLGVPANDFGHQEPGTNAEILQFCTTRFQVTFPLTAKEAVIGPNAHAFYRWAVAEAGQDNAPKWNFHKYLIGPDGQLAGVFGSKTAPDAPEVVAAVSAALGL